MRGFVLAAAMAAAVLMGTSLTPSGASAQGMDAKANTLIVAGGCFWCVESDFDHVAGVTETISGYTGGQTENPTYKQVTAGGSGHYEAVWIAFDPAIVSYETLLNAFWRSVDPLDAGGQFCDRGDSYRTAVFVDSPEQRKIAEATKAAAEKALGKAIVTPILDAGKFYAAEDYHQGYAVKSPVRYKYYRWSCGRDQQVKAIWGSAAYAGIPGKE